MQSAARPQNLDNSSCLIKSFLSRTYRPFSHGRTSTHTDSSYQSTTNRLSFRLRMSKDSNSYLPLL